MNMWLRGVIGAGAAFAAAIVAAVGVAVLDLYLTGHGQASITREIVSEPALGVHISLGDIILLVAALAVGSVTWRGLK